jgi:hypothetical protein
MYKILSNEITHDKFPTLAPSDNVGNCCIELDDPKPELIFNYTSSNNK